MLIFLFQNLSFHNYFSKGQYINQNLPQNVLYFVYKHEMGGFIMLLSQRLYSLRKERNLTLQALHFQTGVSMASLSAYERGKYAPTLENLCKLADFYGITLDNLLGRI